MKRAARRRQDRRETGAALVELAVVAPFFFLLLFGAIEFGLTLNHDVSLTNGVREGARQGVVANYTGNDSTCIGAGAAAAQLACFTKHNIGLGSQTAVAVSFPVGPSYTVGQTMRVCASYPMTSITSLLAPFLNGHFLHAEVRMRLEQSPGVSPGSFTDTQQAGDSPFSSWCT
jgi:Flp pilus assembly protein TadG